MTTMECPDDLDASLISDGEIGQVDFLQEIQQNLSKFQTMMDKLGSRVEQLENTTRTHSQNCTCMNSAATKQLQASTLSPNGKSIQNPNPEIALVDSKVTALDSRVESLRSDLKTLASSIKGILEQKQTQTDKAGSMANVRSPAPASASSTELTASKLVNQRKPMLGGATGTQTLVRPPPPMLMRAPAMSANTTPLKANTQQQQQRSPASATAKSPAPLANVTANYDNGSDEDDENEDDEYEGEEENQNDGAGNPEEDQDDSFMQIEPEVIMYDDDEEEDRADLADYPQGGDGEGEFGGEDEFEDGLLDYDLGLGKIGGEDEGPMVEIEFRDKLGNIVRCLAYQLTGKIKCSICDVECMSRRNIIRHYNNKHADPKYFECSVCGAILNRKDSLTVHLRNQHNVIEQGGTLVLAPSPVADTSQPTTSGGEVASPIPKSSTATTVQYSCNSCGKSFSRIDALTAHKCPVNKSNNGLQSAAAPMRPNVLKKPKPKQQEPQSQSLLLNPTIAKKCPLCPKTFTVRSYLVRHLKAHTQNNQCVACGKVYSRRDKLRAHQRKHHGQILDDNYIDQNLNMNRTYDDGEGDDGLFSFGAGDIGDVDLDMDDADEGGDEGLLSTPMWEYS